VATVPFFTPSDSSAAALVEAASPVDSIHFDRDTITFHARINS
jgi:hypothetical protein